MIYGELETIEEELKEDIKEFNTTKDNSIKLALKKDIELKMQQINNIKRINTPDNEEDIERDILNFQIEGLKHDIENTDNEEEIEKLEQRLDDIYKFLMEK